MAKEKDKQLSVDIQEEYGYLNEKKNKIFAKVQWGTNEPKLDIRKCFVKDGSLVLAGGISLTEDELDTMVELAQSSKRKGVDFQEIFDTAESIQENRHKGFRTEDGFIRLHPKKPLF